LLLRTVPWLWWLWLSAAVWRLWLRSGALR
jgi:hypothetical protein